MGLGLFSTLDQSSGLGKQIGYGLLTGVGVGNTLQPALIAVQAGVERRDMAVVTSFRKYVSSHHIHSQCLTAHQLRPEPWRDTRPCNCRNNNVSASYHIRTYFANTPSNNIVASSISILDLSDSESRSLLSSPRTFLSKQSAENASHIQSVLIPAYQKGFRIIFIIGASLAALAFFMAYGLMPQLGLKRADDEALKKEGEKRVKGELDEEKRG